MSFLKPRHVKWFYGNPALTVYSIIILVGIGLLILNPRYFPEYNDYFISENYFITIFLNFILGTILLSVHELSHLFSGRVQGIYGKIGIGLRLYFPVAETDLTGLWRLEPKKRNLPLLAGIINDLFLTSIGIILLYAFDQEMIYYPLILYRIINACILILFYGLIWQLMFFMKTDLYYALSNILGVRNLYEESWNYILYNIRKLWGLEGPYLDFPEKDFKIIKIYSISILILSIYSVYTFTFYGIPIFSIIILESTNSLVSEPRLNTLLPHLVTLVFTIIQLIIFIYYLVRILFNLLNQLKQ